MPFVTSGKPSGAPSVVVVFFLVAILIPDWSPSFAAVFVVDLKAPMLLVVSDWLHVGIQMEAV